MPHPGPSRGFYDLGTEASLTSRVANASPSSPSRSEHEPDRMPPSQADFRQHNSAIRCLQVRVGAQFVGRLPKAIGDILDVHRGLVSYLSHVPSWRDSRRSRALSSGLSALRNSGEPTAAPTK